MKRLIALLAVFGLLASLAGCAGGGQDIVETTEAVADAPATADTPVRPLEPEGSEVPPEEMPSWEPPAQEMPGEEPPPEQAGNVLPLPPQEGGEAPVQKPGDIQTPPGQKPVPGEQADAQLPTLPAVTQPGNEPTVCGHAYQAAGYQAPGCIQVGYQSYRCGKCGDTKQELQQPLGHAFGSATCVAAKTCSRCGQTEGSPLGHSFSGGSCSRCGAKDTADRTVCIYLKDSSNTPVPGVKVDIYIGDGLSAHAGSTVSDGSGVVRFSLGTHTGSYKLVLSGIPGGYTARTDSYTFKADSGAIVLDTVPVIKPDDHSKAAYKVGATMGDFTITDVDGRTYQLSELLKSKKLVILNFWYYTCVPCKAEFPYFDEVYRKYGNEIELLAMNHFDSEEQIRKLRDEMGLSFPVLQEALGMQQGFGIQSYPVTVFIGSDGRILKIQKDVGFESTQELETLVLQMIGQ